MSQSTKRNTIQQKTGAQPGSSASLAPPRRFRRPLDPIGAEVPGVTCKAFERFGFHAADLLVNWPAIAGPALASYTVPRKIKWARRPDAVVAVPDDGAIKPHRVDRSVLQLWVDQGRAHEIPYLKAAILERINQYFGFRAITDIEPITGPVARSPKNPPPPQLAPTNMPDDPLERALLQMREGRQRRQQKV